MIKKVDLVMWTKNSARMLPLVLKRISDIIPSEFVAKRIIVDDHSEDNTVKVARSFGWKVYKNRGKGIKEAVATALSHVTANFFISVEHDVILSKNWWEKISKYMEDESVVVAQGVRFSTHPVLRKLDEYIAERGNVKDRLVSIDNNIYRTAFIRKLGYTLHDRRLRKGIRDAGLKWVIDKNVISDHIRYGIMYQLKHSYNLHLITRVKPKFSRILRIFLSSPFRALHIVLKKKCPQMLFVYPLIRFMILKACLDRRKLGQK